MDSQTEIYGNLAEEIYYRSLDMKIKINGKTINWTHYQMMINDNTFSQEEPNKENIWSDLMDNLRSALGENKKSLVLSKAGMAGVGNRALSRSELIKAGNFVCLDICDDASKELPELHLKQLSLDNLQDISPQFDTDYQQSHKMIHPYINFGYQNDPTKIYLAEVL